MPTSRMIVTKVEEAPELASASLVPILRSFFDRAASGIDVEVRDISVANRVLALFPERLKANQIVNDDLAALANIVKEPSANIIKLPNMSAVEGQLQDAITELKAQGYDVPDYPVNPSNPEEEAIRAKYDKVLGSAVNPVLREGNSLRMLPQAVIDQTRRKPHRMGEWKSDSKTEVTYMTSGDFRSSEQSFTLDSAKKVRIEFVGEGGEAIVLKDQISLKNSDIVDSAVMDRAALRAFLDEKLAEAKEKGVAASYHFKATMMIKTDGIFFGDAVVSYFKPVFEKHAALFRELGVDPKKGLADIRAKIAGLQGNNAEAVRAEIEQDIANCLAAQAPLMQVDTKKGVTNLDAPNLVIADVSQANVGRWVQVDTAPGVTMDTMAIMPDHSYAPIYAQAIDFFKTNGSLDPKTMGHVENVGLMAAGAEEYGSKATTFEAKGKGVIRIVTAENEVLNEQPVNNGDIWRMCKTGDAAIKNWVQLGVERARFTNAPTIFWLDEKRPHDVRLLAKVRTYLAEHDTAGLDIRIQAPDQAMKTSLELIKEGKNVVSVTGNVLRDYLTDFFPILGVGNSSQMLSQVPLLDGGLVGETGSAGTAPKHVEQLESQGHLRWNSLGEFFAIEEALRFEHAKNNNDKAGILADALKVATGRVVESGKVPDEKELDTRVHHYFLALYWAQALGAQDQDATLKAEFSQVATRLEEDQVAILAEINAARGKKVDVGGHYHPDQAKVDAVMRPSSAFNTILELAA